MKFLKILVKIEKTPWIGDNFTELLLEEKPTDLNKLKLWQKLKPVASGEKIEQLKEVDEKEKRSRLRSILLGEERQAGLKNQV